MRSVPTELQEQKAFIRWLQLKGIAYFAIPNGSKRTRWQAQQAKAEGMVAGAPDLAVILPRGVTVWIEMKRRKGGTQTQSQKQMQERLEACGHLYHVCRGWEEAKAFVNNVILLMRLDGGDNEA